MPTLNHSVIHTGGNIYNDYISDFDTSGRIIIVSYGGIYLYANDRDYQVGGKPIVIASGIESPDDAICADCGETHSYDEIGLECKVCVKGTVVSGAGFESIEEDSQIADLSQFGGSVFVRDTEGATLTVYCAAD